MEQSKVIELEFPTIQDPRGNLSVIEASKMLPFKVERLYYLHSVPATAVRGGHAHLRLQQCIVAIAGSFDVVTHDGRSAKKFGLSAPSQGLYIPQMLWRELKNFSPNAVCLVLASESFDESDYIRDFGRFLAESTK